MFAEKAPQIKTRMIWDELLEADLPKIAEAGEMVIHDPCAVADEPGLLESARLLAAKLGLTVNEPPHSGRLTNCCGFGGLVAGANPDMAKSIAESRGREAGGAPLLTYCAMCRERFAAAGQKTAYMLDFIFHGDAAEGRPGLSRRRANRLELKTRLLKDKWPEKMTAPEPRPWDDLKLNISPELAAELDKRRILEQDLRRAIHEALRHKTFFVSADGGGKLAVWKPNNVTFWVEFKEDGPGEFTILRAWSHRMTVPEPIQEEAGQ